MQEAGINCESEQFFSLVISLDCSVAIAQVICDRSEKGMVGIGRTYYCGQVLLEQHQSQ